MRAVIYTRQSLDKTGDGLGIDRQERECRRLCELRGWTVLEVLTDNSRSASVGNRPAYRQLLNLMEQGGCDVVVVLRLDRLLRKMTELEALIELSERTSVQVATVQGDLDLSNSTGRLLGRILASVARSEVELKSERHKLANAQKAQLGKPHGSRRPYGYEDDLITLRPAEADVLHEMGERIMAGHGFKDTAYWANEQGHRTTTGKLWYPLTVRNMLQKPRYGGLIEYEGVEYPAVYVGVFSPDEWEKLQLTIRLRREKAGDKPVAAKYLLTGMLVCGVCGGYLNGSAKRDRAGAPLRRVYMCRVQGDTKRKGGCGKVRRNADALDAFIKESVLSRLDTPELLVYLNDSADDGSQERFTALLEERRTYSDRLDGFVDNYATGLLDAAQFARAKNKAEVEIAKLDKQIAAQARSTTAAGIMSAGQTMREAWDSNGNDWRRELLGLLMTSITVKQGNTKPFYEVNGMRYRFDPRLIVIDWIA